MESEISHQEKVKSYTEEQEAEHIRESVERSFREDFAEHVKILTDQGIDEEAARRIVREAYEEQFKKLRKE